MLETFILGVPAKPDDESPKHDPVIPPEVRLRNVPRPKPAYHTYHNDDCRDGQDNDKLRLLTLNHVVVWLRKHHDDKETLVSRMTIFRSEEQGRRNTVDIQITAH